METAVSTSHPTMRAILQPAYGPPAVLVQASVDRPALRADGVMVRVAAASLHKGDWHLLTGTPYLLRLAGFGLFKPNHPIPGMAIAGRVEAVGPEVEDFEAGDEVFGEIRSGGFAEYVCVGAHELAHKPAGMSFEDAATLPVSATTALQGLRDAGRLQAGQSVLINGAAGGVGTFAVQIAKALGASVTGVCSAGNVALVRSLGADHVVDYSAEDFTDTEKQGYNDN
jgi:NADPH:quinone reductase-like Zn-dependent oxidoreductase